MSNEKKIRKRNFTKDKKNESTKDKKAPHKTQTSYSKKIISILIIITCGILFSVHFKLIDYQSILGYESLSAGSHASSEDHVKSNSEAPAVNEDVKTNLEENDVEKKDLSHNKKTSAKSKKEKNKKEEQITAPEDKPILNEIKEAEKLIKRKNIQQAVSLFEKLLKTHPNSPRLRYGLANALLAKAEKERSNEILLEGINQLKKAATMPNTPIALKKEIRLLSLNKYTFLGKYREALQLMKEVIREFPNDVDVLNQYGVLFLTINQNDRAKSIYERVLKIDPNNGFAKVHLGFIVKVSGGWEESIKYLREGLQSDAPGVHDGKFYFHLGDALFRTGHKEEAEDWYQKGADRGLFFSKYQRSLYNVNRLKSRPFWTAEQAKVTDIVKKLESNWKTIRSEALKVMNVEEGLFLHEEESLKNTGEWRQFTLYSRGNRHKECDRTPKTCALISKMHVAAGCKRGQIKYSIMMPGTHVWPHTGPTNCRLRMHLGLVIPKTGNGTKLRCADETRTWEEGKVMIFDDSFEHEVWQEAESYRLIFIIDIWHPDLTDRERRTLAPI